MIIRTIHIDSFGGLRDFTLEPDAGANVIFGPNESGKSSLAGFVKFMLYGLPSREKSANPEKSRALSRDGGSASGWMTVRTDGGEDYRLERSVRPGDTGSLRDRVRIVNEKTGESAEGVNPGEFFLGVPEEVFSSTAFVRQGSLRPGTPEGSASGNGAMRGAVENLLTSADESVDLRRAAAALEEQKRVLSQKNGGGEISALAEKRAALLAERNSTAVKTSEALSLSVSLDDIRRRIAELESSRARYAGIFDSLDKITVKRRIDAADETESQLKKVRSALAALTPGEDVLFDEGFDELLNEAERDVRTYEEERIAFRERFPGERDIPDKLRPYPFTSGHEPEKEEEAPPPDVPADGPIPASALKEMPGEEEVEPYEDTGALAMEGEFVTDGGGDDLPDPHEAIEAVRRMARINKAEFFAGILAACLALLGLGLSIGLSGTDISPIPALIATLALMTLSLGMVVAHVATSSRLNAMLAEWNAESADEIEIAVQEHTLAMERKAAGMKERKRLSASLESARVRRNAAVSRINGLADRAGISPRQDVHETLRLLRQKNKAEASDRRQLAAKRSQLEGRLEVLREQLGEVDVSAAELDAHRALGTVWGREAASLTQDRMKELMRERDFTESALRSAELRRASLEQKLAEIGKITRTVDELDTMIEAADDRMEELTLRRDALELASEALKKAGESVRQGIIPRIAASASRRVRTVSGTWDRMLLDDRLSCSLSSDDGVLGSELLSRGTADLSWLSLRLALAGELFRSERPPVILDESFAHMDADRTARFLSTLTGSASPQTLVFTCRSDEADAARELGYPVFEL